MSETKFAKSLVQAAFAKGIINKDVTAEELLSVIPDDGDLTVSGGVLAWSGWAFIYPNSDDGDESKE